MSVSMCGVQANAKQTLKSVEEDSCAFISQWLGIRPNTIFASMFGIVGDMTQVDIEIILLLLW